MKTVRMTGMKRIASALAVSISVGIAAGIIAGIAGGPIAAWAVAVNNYRGKSYDGSVEEVQEYENMLKEDGYKCVTSGCTENEEWTEFLLANESVANTAGLFLDGDGEDYKFYVFPRDYEQFADGNMNANSFLNNCQAVDYYSVSHSEADEPGLVGDELDYAGVPFGFITVYLNVDDDLRAEGLITYSVILEDGVGKKYDLSSSAFADNEYVVRTKLPVGIYHVSSVFADNDHTADLSQNSFYDANKKTGSSFAVKESTNTDLIIDFKKMVPDEEMAEGEKVGHNIDADSGNAKVQMEDGVVVAPIVAEKQTPAWVRIAAGIGGFIAIILVFGIPLYMILKRMKERDSEIQ